MSTTQATHRTRTTALRMCAYIAPLVAQCIMLIALLVRQQWLFALMIGSGCCATAATMVLMLLQSRPTPSESSGDSPHSTAYASGAIGENPVRACTGTTLEYLHGMADDAAPFRTICHSWTRTACSPQPPGCSARIGIDPHGQLLSIDLERHGPHAIVAGTTGSGKSVLLQDWCLALAATYPPQSLQFALLDFKGGSAMERLCALPHVRGCVNDLDLKYAIRALRALERELDRRERLAAALGVSDLMQAACPVARLVIVVDEFHMLHGQLPDYIDRLVRIASLGRSLGMHLVVCTQNPLGQISASMKANMSLRICLRVRDALQSQEMIGSDAAAHLSAAAPGMAILMEDDERRIFRCAHIEDIDAFIGDIKRCARVHACTAPPPLFTDGLPDRVDPQSLPETCAPGHLPLGLVDDGVAVAPFVIDTRTGPLAVVGQHGRGKSALLRWITQAAPAYGVTTACTDDADDLLDPLCMDVRASALRAQLRNPHTFTVFALSSTRRLRVPEHCTRRLILPCGERAVDLADGIPAELLNTMDGEDMRTPGRAVYIDSGAARIVQLMAAS
ncbi:FtsK/SpoIIIE domain-containing protein [Bifidobacterium pseudolongum]|uniref:FtsK/SpoIIIE domain-containing protein n=1 Tax=Bifidobacterium pseudolongum TaxID=1694 RepID=UPI0010E8906E|nr:FtsK/SpoIIIE domain-containing protein [Bifidobacterium pseudolongum]RYQ53175.1 FHA domain-containing protein [Bifidobacterium pseudolongum subsp. pseudolongum]